MKKVLVILGPTVTGKTDVALSLARKYNGELVACDSRQVYKGLDIGTGKEPRSDVSCQSSDIRLVKENGYWEIGGVRVWMYDVVNPDVQYTVKDYVEQAGKVVEDMLQKGKLSIIVGGTGLYLKGLLHGFSNLNIPVDEKLRGELEKLSLKELQEKLIALSPTRFNELSDSDKKNPRRLLRSIEIISMNPYANTAQISKLKTQNWDVLKIGLTAPRQVLNEKINSRVFDWVNQGIVREVDRLRAGGVSWERFRDFGLEYAVAAQHLQSVLSGKQMIEQMQARVRQYAKRQVTWFKKEPDVTWFDIADKGWQDQVEKMVDIWYHAGT